MAATATYLVSDPYIETFQIPNERKAHENSFPLGIKDKHDTPFNG
jgi:hypothetical protein